MIEIDVIGNEEIRRALARVVPEFKRKALQAGAQAAFDTAQREADRHTKTGALARSVTMRPQGNGYVIGHDSQMAPHAVFVHWGTRPHEIRPKNKQALRWPAGGGFAFAKVVQHPGFEGDPWMIRARDAAAAAILRIARNTDA